MEKKEKEIVCQMLRIKETLPNRMRELKRFKRERYWKNKNAMNAR